QRMAKAFPSVQKLRLGKPSPELTSLYGEDSFSRLSELSLLQSFDPKEAIFLSSFIRQLSLHDGTELSDLLCMLIAPSVERLIIKRYWRGLNSNPSRNIPKLHPRNWPSLTTLITPISIISGKESRFIFLRDMELWAYYDPIYCNDYDGGVTRLFKEMAINTTNFPALESLTLPFFPDGTLPVFCPKALLGAIQMLLTGKFSEQFTRYELSFQ
ncbi:4135_t:CDS:2, partial [Acaulospora colombiana]